MSRLSLEYVSVAALDIISRLKTPLYTAREMRPSLVMIGLSTIDLIDVSCGCSLRLEVQCDGRGSVAVFVMWGTELTTSRDVSSSMTA